MRLSVIQQDAVAVVIAAASPAHQFVDPPSLRRVYSLAEAWVHYKDTKPFAIYADETMIGFVSMYVGEENYQIINFFIDDAYQKKGYGTAAAKLCIDFLYKEYKARRVSAPVNQRHTAAQKFWTKLGFAYSDSVEDGYVFMRLNLV